MLLRFAPFSSAPKVEFWQELGRRKLEDWRLDDSAKPIGGTWSPGGKRGPPRMEFTSASLTQGHGNADGEVVLVNTLDAFKATDKAKLLSSSKKIVCLVFGDLKRQRYVYWFGFPAPVMDPPLNRGNGGLLTDLVDDIKDFSGVGLEQFYAKIEKGKVVWTGESRPVEDGDGKNIVLACVDPATGDEPGWPAREALANAIEQGCTSSIVLVLLRSDVVGESESTSRWIEVLIPSGGCRRAGVTGWEMNAAGRPGPRSVDLATITDPAELAAQASALNLHLMKWRLLPDLDTTTIAQTKCLLIGAGTLGCNVARLLVAWGVRHVTLVDDGKVSYSNPARQPLYTVSDCAQNKFKALAAADALIAIAPSSQSSPAKYEGVVMQVPMPGRGIVAGEEARRDFEKLRDLVAEHDAVFILTDTREARWLPTVLAVASPNRPSVLNVALGLDTYVVVRHGAGDDRLGCYFCNDVAAPGDSTRDRTLDQQCTVSRPGLAPIASALAVELLVALLHHPQRHNAPAVTSQDLHQRPDHPLGILPHSIRGFLTHYTTILPANGAFPHCAACSEPVIDRFSQSSDEAFDFLVQVAEDPALLERISGLTELVQQHEYDPDSFILEDDDDDDADTLA